MTAAPRRLAFADLPLAELPMPRGTMALTRSLASGLTRRAGDPPGVFWGVGDRGPNIKPAKAAKRYGLSDLARIEAGDGAKVLPLPEIGPQLARFRLTEDGVALEATFALTAPDGTQLSPLPPPSLPGMETEPIFDLNGRPLGTSMLGADPEAIAALADGRFWIAEEYGPSLLLVTAEGAVERRVVPEGTTDMFGSGRIPVVAGLPAIALARKLNRGFEALAVSPDGRTLFAMFQSTLAHPDRAAHDAGDLVRLWALDAASGALQAEFAYPLDPPTAFARDQAAEEVAGGDVKVSELATHPDGSLLVLERVTRSTHIYRIRPDPACALPPRFLDPAHRPTLEQLGQAGARREGVPVLAKERLFSTDDHPAIPADLEGMIVLDDGSLLLVNDSDYGIEGASTQFWQVDLA